MLVCEVYLEPVQKVFLRMGKRKATKRGCNAFSERMTAVVILGSPVRSIVFDT